MLVLSLLLRSCEDSLKAGVGNRMLPRNKLPHPAGTPSKKEKPTLLLQ